MIPSGSCKRSVYDWLPQYEQDMRDQDGASVKKTKSEQSDEEDSGCLEPMDIDGLSETMGELEVVLPYDRNKTAKELGWLVGDDYLNFHPKAFRNMTDEDFFAFSMPYPYCKKIRYPEAKFITDNGFCSAILISFSLEDISFSLCHQMTDKTLKVLGDYRPCLRKFSLLQCKQISDAGVMYLASSCKSLTDISLDWCDNLSDASLEAIGRGCPELGSFCLTCSEKFTITGFTALLLGCKKLEKIELWQCPQVNEGWIDVVRKHGASVKEFHLKR